MNIFSSFKKKGVSALTNFDPNSSNVRERSLSKYRLRFTCKYDKQTLR